jgi:hypothetical protein
MRGSVILTNISVPSIWRPSFGGQPVKSTAVAYEPQVSALRSQAAGMVESPLIFDATQLNHLS